MSLNSQNFPVERCPRHYPPLLYFCPILTLNICILLSTVVFSHEPNNILMSGSYVFPYYITNLSYSTTIIKVIHHTKCLLLYNCIDIFTNLNFTKNVIHHTLYLISTANTMYFHYFILYNPVETQPLFLNLHI